jgi:hypothetical protein
MNLNIFTCPFSYKRNINLAMSKNRLEQIKSNTIERIVLCVVDHRDKRNYIKMKTSHSKG